MEFYGLPPIGQKKRRPMDGAQVHLPWVGNAGGELQRNRMEEGKARWPTVGICALPLIEQKTLDEWGTEHLWSV